MKSPKKLQIALLLVLIAGGGGALWMSAQRRLYQEQLAKEQAQQRTFLNARFSRVQKQKQGVLLSPDDSGQSVLYLDLNSVHSAQEPRLVKPHFFKAGKFKKPHFFEPGSRFAAYEFNRLPGTTRYTIIGIQPQGVGVRFETRIKGDIPMSGDIVLLWK